MGGTPKFETDVLNLELLVGGTQKTEEDMATTKSKSDEEVHRDHGDGPDVPVRDQSAPGDGVRESPCASLQPPAKITSLPMIL